MHADMWMPGPLAAHPHLSVDLRASRLWRFLLRRVGACANHSPDCRLPGLGTAATVHVPESFRGVAPSAVGVSPRSPMTAIGDTSFI